MGMYDPLYNFLKGLNVSQVKMSFVDVEQVIGTSLPKTARGRNQWWANEVNPKSRHVQCHAWRDAGFDAEVDLTAQKVVFRKTAKPKGPQRPTI